MWVKPILAISRPAEIFIKLVVQRCESGTSFYQTSLIIFFIFSSRSSNSGERSSSLWGLQRSKLADQRSEFSYSFSFRAS
jgi:hypothetical protein